MGKLWKAREASVKLAASVTVTASAALDTLFSAGTALTGDIKEVTIKEPDYSPEKVDFVGEDAGGFQNADWDEKVYEAATLKGTLVMRGEFVIEPLIYGSGTAVSTTHLRYRPGDGNRKTPAILVGFDDGTYEINFLFDHAHVKLGERKQTADGHAEYDFEATCLPRDYYMEDKIVA
jgi:hypothetical protein